MARSASPKGKRERERGEGGQIGKHGGEGLVWACVYTALFVIVPTLCLWYKHHEAHQAVLFNWTYLLLSLFVVINTMISVWEVALHIYSRHITDSFRQLKKRTTPGTFPPIFMFQPVTFREAMTLKYWSNVWILYSLFDESYSDPKSYGFWIDSGNGFSTLVPGIAFVLGLTYDLMEPRNLGLIGMLQVVVYMHAHI